MNFLDLLKVKLEPETVRNCFTVERERNGVSSRENKIMHRHKEEGQTKQN